MISEMEGDLQMPYLQAIQAIPGDTAGEKLKWIGKLISNRTSGDPEHLPQELLPILRVEIAVNEKKHEDITTALVSKDLTIVSRAFKATWFFDGSHRNIVDAEYFCKRIFPYVCVNTRGRIVTTLANRLTDPEFAQQLFTKVDSIYGINNAYPLIVACDEAFAYKTIEQRKLALPAGIVKKIFRKNPDFAVRYLKLLKPVSESERAPFPVTIDKYIFILPKLVKKRLDTFAELFEMYEACPPRMTLSNTCTEIFLKKGLQYLNKKPRLYIKILPLKKISLEIMQSIFVGLLPEKHSDFQTDKFLEYLQHYAQNARYELLKKAYKTKYGSELLDEEKNVTPALLQILPAKERIEQARIKLEKEKLKESVGDNSSDYQRAWICYLPVNESIPIIKEKINKTSEYVNRYFLLRQMFYACKINEDDEELVSTLKYFKTRHKNEDSWLFERTMDYLMQLYDIPHLNEKQNSVLFDIMRLFYVKFGYVPERILEAMIHFRFIHDMPIDDLIRMLIERNRDGYRWINFNLLKEYPQYERKCLLVFAEILEEKYSDTSNILPEGQTEYEDVLSILTDFVIAMYKFNDRCKKSRTKIERMTIRTYPWLVMHMHKAIIKSHQEYSCLRATLSKNEPEIFGVISSSRAKINTGEALALLKRRPQDILENWGEYVKDICENITKASIASYQVRRFIRATRWYKDIPIKFVKYCIDYIHNEKRLDKYERMPYVWTILAILLHGDTFTKLIKPFIPTQATIDSSHSEARQICDLVHNLSSAMKFSNPPVPLELVDKLCEGDYLTTTLKILINVSRRSCLPIVLSFAHRLYDMRIGARKHAVRLMYQVAPVDELIEFLKEKWNSEDHHSIRQVIFEVVQKLLSTTPNEETWSLHYSVMHTMLLKDEELLSQIELFPSIPNENVMKYLQVWHEAINDLYLLGLDAPKTNKYLIRFLGEMTTAPVCNLLSEEFAQDIMEKYLFVVDTDLSQAGRSFSMLYLFPEDKAKLAVRNEEFIKIFHSVLKTKWNMPHPKKSRFFPYNNGVYLFVKDFIVSYAKRFCFSNKSTDTQVIDNMLKLFSTVLTPTQDVRSYLLLTYTKKLQECASTDEYFGLELGQHVPELVKIFSSSLVQFMAKILDHFLYSVFRDYNGLQEFKLSVMEGLTKAGNTDSCLMAVTMLSAVTLKDLTTRYNQLIVKFHKMKNPAIISILHDHQNMLNFHNVSFD